MSRRFNPTVWRLGDGNSKDEYIIIGIDKQKPWERVADYLGRVIDLFSSHRMSPKHDGQFMYRLFLGGLRDDILQKMLPMGPLIRFQVGIRRAMQWERQCNAEVEDLTEDDAFVYAAILDECDSDGENDAEVEILDDDDDAQRISENFDGQDVTQGVAQEYGAGNSTNDGTDEGAGDAGGDGEFKDDENNMKDGEGEGAGVDEGIGDDVDEGVGDSVGEDVGVSEAVGNGAGMEENKRISESKAEGTGIRKTAGESIGACDVIEESQGASLGEGAGVCEAEGASVAKAEGSGVGKTRGAGVANNECSAVDEAEGAVMAKAKEAKTDTSVCEIQGAGAGEDEGACASEAGDTGVVTAKSADVGEGEYFDTGFEDEAVGGAPAENPADNLLLYDLDDDDEKPYIVQNGEEFFGEPNDQVDHLFHARYVLILYR